MVALFSSLRLDLEHARLGYRRYAAYPGATYAGLFTNTVFGFMRTYVLLAMFGTAAAFGGYDRAAAVSYAWLTQGLMATIHIWGWQDLGQRIRTGDIATDLVRPVHPLRAGLAFDLGRSVYHAIFRGLPPVVIGALTFGLLVPADPLVVAAFLFSVALAVVVSYAFRVIYNAASFWLMDWRGTMMLALIAANFLSGTLVPVGFFPAPLQVIAQATPFPSMVQIPVDIYVGRLAGSATITALAVQAAWAIGLMGSAALLFGRGVRRLVVQGG